MRSPAQLAALAKGRTKRGAKHKKRSSLTHREKSFKSKDTKYDYAEASQLLGVKQNSQAITSKLAQVTHHPTTAVPRNPKKASHFCDLLEVIEESNRKLKLSGMLPDYTERLYRSKRK